MKIFLSLITILLFFVSPVFAAGRTVQGTVSDSSGNPIENAQMTISCLGNQLHTTSNSSGFYAAQFAQLSRCLKGSTVTVTAEKDGSKMTDSKKMGDTFVEINISLPVASVPEFNMTSIVMTGILCTLIVFSYKKIGLKSV